MDAEQIKSLIERIEKSDGADRSIDVLIGATVRWLPPDGQAWLRDWRGDFGPMPRMTGRIAAFHDNGDPAVHWEAPNFSASLDAAATLVPDGWYWTLGGNVHHGHWIASVNTLNSEGEPWCVGCSNACATPALALCAAALKAKIILDAVAK